MKVTNFKILNHYNQPRIVSSQMKLTQKVARLYTTVFLLSLGQANTVNMSDSHTCSSLPLLMNGLLMDHEYHHYTASVDKGKTTVWVGEVNS